MQTPQTELMYHGTCHLFDRFSLDHLGQGEGKSKFGHGIYITSSYTTAALYASKAARARGLHTCYVYTVEVPTLTTANHIFSNRAVDQAVAHRAAQAIGQPIPHEAMTAGKFLRKYLGNLLTGQCGTLRQMTTKADARAEDAASRFLHGIGVTFLAWPQSQTKPDGDTNRAVLDADDIRILRIEQVQTDERNRLLPGTAITITP